MLQLPEAAVPVTHTRGHTLAPWLMLPTRVLACPVSVSRAAVTEPQTTAPNNRRGLSRGLGPECKPSAHAVRSGSLPASAGPGRSRLAAASDPLCFPIACSLRASVSKLPFL